MDKKVGIIWVNFGEYARRFAPAAFSDLLKQSYPRELWELIIVDNCSTPESRAYLAETCPGCHIIERPDGNYAAGNNAGLEKAREMGMDLYLIANFDARYDEQWIEELVRAAEAGTGAEEEMPKIGAIQSKMLLCPVTGEFDRQACKINSLGNCLHFLGFGFTNGYNEPDCMIEGYPEIPGYASGCALMIKPEVIDVIKGYNEDYYMYHDDVEMGWKIKLAGYKIILAPRSVIYHKYEFKRAVQMLFYMERNRYWAFFTFYKTPTILLLLPALLAMDLGMLFFSAVNGWFGTKLKLYRTLLTPAFWKVVRRERGKVSGFRQVADKEIMQAMVSEVLFQEIDNPVLRYIANPVFNLYYKIARKLVRW